MSDKLCECGCGLPAPIAARTDRRAGAILGQPRRFQSGHNSRRALDLTQFKITEAGYQTPCWIWTGNIQWDGYARVQVLGVGKRPHRLAFEAVNGPVPVGLFLDHLCRNRACVRPDHMEAVTAAENTRRGLSAKVTKEQVSSIRRDTRAHKEIAREYGIHPRHVSYIKCHRYWRDP